MFNNDVDDSGIARVGVTWGGNHRAKNYPGGLPIFLPFSRKFSFIRLFLVFHTKKSLDSYKQFSDDLFLAFHSKKFDDTYLRNSFLMLVSPLLMVSYGVTRGGPPSPSLDAPV